MGFVEIGVIIRLVFIYRFNIKRMNLTSKKFTDREDSRNFWTGFLFFALVVIIGIIKYNIG